MAGFVNRIIFWDPEVIAHYSVWLEARKSVYYKNDDH